MQNYYPWNTSALLEWLKQELNHHGKQALGAKLNIPRYVIQSWLSEPSPTITLSQIRAIAQYKGWNLTQIIDWLQLQPAHIQELMNQDASAAGQ
ncbi:hypothetical protein [Nodosilinea nodulosa]|uniref:hypothetical protein n=1 Tax=Nodosilinea nodulosa TaxID=416001 RepID=UPI0002F00EE0|nr:hypothetical protein [Nodosilinea nodulosa]